MADKPWDDYDDLSPDEIRKRAKAEVTATLRVLTTRLNEIYNYENRHQGRPDVKENLGDLRKQYTRFRNDWTNRWTNRW
jgi:hypothetical protein